jgi:hypothetical protein
VNRDLQLRLICALAASAACTPALAREKPQPSFSIDPIVARSLLAPVDDGAESRRAYRLDPGLDPAGGERARLSLDLGDATMFAITGRLQRRSVASGPLESRDARALGQYRDSGKVYGAGVSANLHGVDVSATYQYSKLRSEQGETESVAGGPGRSHSLRATARLRF